MEDNSIYSSWQEGESGRPWATSAPPPSELGLLGADGVPCCLLAVGEFQVVMQRTKAATRCQLKGPYLLVLSQDGIQLRETSSPQTLYSWPYHFLRKFGSDKVRCLATPPLPAGLYRTAEGQ